MTSPLNIQVVEFHTVPSLAGMGNTLEGSFQDAQVLARNTFIPTSVEVPNMPAVSQFRTVQ